MMRQLSSTLPNGVRRLFQLPRSRARMLRETDDELRFHFAMRVAELQALGMDESAAEAEALCRFGDRDEYQAYVARRAARRALLHRAVEWLAAWTQDIHFAIRQWRKAPGFTATALLTLALGIGANTAIFSVVHRLLLAPLPYPNGNRIVIPMAQDAQGDLGSIDSTLLKAWRARSRSIDEIAAADEETFSLRPDGSVDSITYAGITSNFLHVLGVRPLLGRTFTLEEERSGAALAMISYGFWQRAYGGRPDVLGSSVHFGGKSYDIVGVTPPDLALPMASEWARTRPAVSLPTPDLWIPETLETASEDGFPAPNAFATLRPGVSAEIASRELQAIAEQMPDAAHRYSRVRAMRAQDFLDSREARAVRVLFVAVGALLLIACANVANLLLARAWVRRREFAVRLSLGAGRGRVARQALAESLLLALAGGVLGIGVASQTLRLIIALRPVSLDHLADVHLEPQVLLWALAISIATGLLFGCAPVFFVGGATVNDVLRTETPAGSGSHVSSRARSTLIVFEIALSLALLVSAGLLLRSFRDLQQMALGFEPRRLVSLDMLMGARPRDSRLAIRNEIVERLRGLPGVTGVTIGMLPGKGFLGDGFEAESRHYDARNVVRAAGTSFISPDYFRIARIPLLEGRVPDSLSLDASWKSGRSAALSPEVVVNRALARRLWPDGHAIGSRLRPTPDKGGAAQTAPWSTVVGIAQDIHMAGIHDDSRALQVYTLIHPRFPEVPVLVRTEGASDEAAAAIRQIIKRIDPGIAVRPATTGEAYLRDSLAPARFAMALLAGFAAIAMVLSAVGLYGVIAYTVTQRTRELGIRIALGAEPKWIATLVVGAGLRHAVMGISIGAVIAVASSRLISSMLYAVSPADPLTIVAAIMLIGGVSLLASYMPARRAARIDPIRALRVE